MKAQENTFEDQRASLDISAQYLNSLLVFFLDNWDLMKIHSHYTLWGDRRVLNKNPGVVTRKWLPRNYSSHG